MSNAAVLNESPSPLLLSRLQGEVDSVEKPAFGVFLPIEKAFKRPGDCMMLLSNENVTWVGKRVHTYRDSRGARGDLWPGTSTGEEV